MKQFDAISDLHLDMRPNPVELLMNVNPTSDMLVIAGDMCEIVNLERKWLDILCAKYTYVVYVPGNHEYFHNTLNLDWQQVQQNAPRNFYILNDTEIEIGGIRWAGTTLWYPDGVANVALASKFADFKFIRDFAGHVYQVHDRAMEFLSNATAEVWVTHHMPFANSIHPKYHEDPTNAFFYGRAESALMRCPVVPKVVVHGHTHESMDYMLGDTQVHCNPFGYEFEKRMEIVPRMVSF